MSAVERSDCNKEYEKNLKLRKEDVQHIKEWLDKQSHLPKITEFMMIQFYITSEYSLLKTKSLIDGHYKFRNDAPELFIGRDMDKERLNESFFDTWYFIPIYDTKNSMNVIYVGLKHSDASKFTWESFATMLLKNHFTTLHSKGSCDRCNWIIDCEGFGFSHLASARISLLRHLVNYFQNYIPMNIPKIYLVRMNPFAEKFYLLVKQFFNEEMNKKVNILSSLENVFEFTPKEYLPIDIGGSFPHSRDELNEIEKVRLEALDDIVIKEMNLKSDESKRSGNPVKDLTKHASFKKLQID